MGAAQKALRRCPCWLVGLGWCLYFFWTRVHFAISLVGRTFVGDDVHSDQDRSSAITSRVGTHRRCGVQWRLDHWSESRGATVADIVAYTVCTVVQAPGRQMSHLVGTTRASVVAALARMAAARRRRSSSRRSANLARRSVARGGRSAVLQFLRPVVRPTARDDDVAGRKANVATRRRRTR